MRRAGAESHRSFALLIAVLVTLAAGLALDFTGAAGRLELDSVDARFPMRTGTTPPEVALVAIDDVTFDELQRRWPFPRTVHARMVDALTAAGARTILYDVQFTEPSKNPDEDYALYDALDRSRRVVLATTEVDEQGRTNVMGGDENLRAAGARAGAAYMPTDAGGVIRRFPHAVSGLESLAVAAAERASGREIPTSPFPPEGAWIDYAGPPGTVPTYSFSRVLHGRFPDDAFRGKVVVVGATSPSLQDTHPTPVSGGDPMSGPEVQANAVTTALHGLPLRSAPRWADMLTILLAAVLTPLLAWRLRLVPALVFAVLGGAAYVLGSVLAFDRGTVLIVAVPLLTLAVGLLATVVAQYLGETRARRFYARYSRVLEDQVAARTEELRTAQREILERLGQAVELREAETGRHVERVSRLSEALALEVGIPASEADIVRLAAALHDIGKIGIPDRVLLKDGTLDEDEWEVMRAHTMIGARILAGSSSPLMRMAETIARTHHEWWDGSGYPEGLAGAEIPIVGRITAIADVFDALVSSRAYKEAWPLPAAIAELREHAGRHFDPNLVEAFARIAPRLYDELGYGAPAAAPVEAVRPAP
ncbi:MAG: CHASE2 domain-containing protein [Thermoleophilia bacterium]